MMERLLFPKSIHRGCCLALNPFNAMLQTAPGYFIKGHSQGLSVDKARKLAKSGYNAYTILWDAYTNRRIGLLVNY
jgi:hypothetical protein